ncbi:MAG: hypothetical protein ACFE9L_13585 [Candidatus Hodarchaeota archaeon]
MNINLFQPDKAAWQASIRENKPIIFFFQDNLCLNCQNFHSNVINYPKVQEVLKIEFIPIFLDIHRYPEIYDRYYDAVGSLHHFFSVGGSLLGNCSHSSPQAFIRKLKHLKQFQPKVSDPFPDLQESQVSYTKTFSEESKIFHQKMNLIAEITLSSLLRSYDRLYDGWNLDGIKNHPSKAIELFLLLYQRSRDLQLLNIIMPTLRASYKGLYDKRMGGYFECSNRDWNRVVSYQKTIDNNIETSRNLFHTYQITNDRQYLDIVDETLKFCINALWDESKGLFRYAILVHPEKPSLTNESFFTRSNCDAANFLLEVNEILKENFGERDYKSLVRRILDVLKKSVTEFGIPHDLEAERERYQYLLQDQAAYLELLLYVYSTTGGKFYLQKAEKLIEIIMKHYFDKKTNLFKDRVSFSQNDFGPLNAILYPIRENARIIGNFLTYSYLEMNSAYKEIAKRCATSYYTNFGISRDEPYPPEFVIANQRLVESPIELIIIGSDDSSIVQQMVIEIKKIYDPFKIIQILNPVEDISLIQKKIPEISDFERPMAFIKIENTVSPPTFYPSEISKILNTLLDAIKVKF